MGGNCSACNQGEDINYKTKSNAFIDQRAPEKRLPATESCDQAKKFLLLGPGESGKSTVLKQLKLHHGNGFTDNERNYRRDTIYSNLIEAMKALLAFVATKGYAGTPGFRIEGMYAEAYDLIQAQPLILDELSPEVADALALLWTAPAVQEAYTHRSEFQLLDSCKYFMERLDAIREPDWIPSDEDMLRARSQTVGVLQPQQFTVETESKLVNFSVVDIGGQKNQREKKWLHAFSGVDLVIFLVGTSEFDQTMREAKVRRNRLVDTLECFRKTFNDDFPKEGVPDILLFFNKMDIFKEKLDNGKDIRDCPAFADYKGNCNVEEALDYIEKVFLEEVQDLQCSKWCMRTTATDPHIMKDVLDTLHTSQIGKQLSALMEFE